MSNKPEFILRLYVAGQTSKSITAIQNLKDICEINIKGRYNLEVIDLQKNPRLAHDHQIFALPTLVRLRPKPVKQIIGDLSDSKRVLAGLDILNAREIG